MNEYTSKPDKDAYYFNRNYGEFSEKKENQFQKKLKRLHKYAQMARREFPCLKGKESQFLDYIFQQEPPWYGYFKMKDIK